MTDANRMTVSGCMAQCAPARCRLVAPRPQDNRSRVRRVDGHDVDANFDASEFVFE
jgi:hypothetical protein